MKILFISLVVFSFCYFTLRYLKLFWEKRQLPEWSRFLLGILAWGALLGSLGILWGLLEPIIQLLTAPSQGVAFLMMGEALAVGMIAKYANANPELFDFPSMKAFLKDSLAFANPARSWMNLAEEVDRHEVRRVYKEVTGNDLPGTDERFENDLQKKLDAAKSEQHFSGDKRVKTPKEALELLGQTITSPHANEELRQLREGARVDISDSWTINSMKRSSHEYFRMVKNVVVDPAAKTAEFRVESELMTETMVREQVSLYRLKQALYDFLQAACHQDWMQPYLQFAALIRCTACRFSDEAFVGVQVRPLCRVEITRDELRQYANRFYDVGNMKTEVLI